MVLAIFLGFVVVMLVAMYVEARRRSRVMASRLAPVREVPKAIPAAYTEWIGAHLMSYVTRNTLRSGHGAAHEGERTAERDGEVPMHPVGP